jgi:hypothetical protein
LDHNDAAAEREGMRQIRVALGEVHSAMLRDILSQITALQPDMVLVGRVRRPTFRADIASQRPDVLICDVRPEELPEVYRELFADPDPPIVVGLAREGREAAVCIPNAGAGQLMSIVRSAIRDTGEGSRPIEFQRPLDGERDGAATDPYISNSDCLNDQFRCLDLVLLAEVEAFEATTWDEGAQRLQGLAITPDEVRALLHDLPPAADQRQRGELSWRRQRLVNWTSMRLAATRGRPDAPPFVRLIERLGLNPFEQFCLVAALAVEIDRNKYGKAFALLQDDVTRRQPSWELLLRLHAGPGAVERWDAVRAFDASRPLQRWNLLRFGPRDAGESVAPFSRRVEIDDRMSRFLLGLADLGPQLEEFAAAGPWAADALHVPAPARVADRLTQLVTDVRRGARGAPPRLIIHVHGRPGTGRRSLITAISQAHGQRLLRVDAGRLATAPAATFDEGLALLSRECVLEPTVLCFENVDTLLEDDTPSAPGMRALVRALGTLSTVTFVLSQRPWAPENLFGKGTFQSVALELPDAAEARRLWTAALGDVSLAPETGGAENAAAELGGRFHLSPGQIHDAVAAAQTRALWEKPLGAPLILSDLYRACREQCSQRLGALARRVTSGFGWKDLILPAAQFGQLRELETAIRNASGVLQDWNFQSRLPYGRGITALFSGPSGTGKTMAAGILAAELGLDLYAVDLSRVVSKYIGETEKNLDRIFAQAEDADAMLFFDEADALFGKRSAIKDAHDRYANIEIAYLLQKMEERLGVTILATNLKTNMDEAFLRRIRFAVEFPLPDYAQRREIWRSSLPKEICLADDVDLTLLARRLRVSGGSIMSMCLGAASLAYQPGGAIRMEHFAQAATRELQKLGLQYNESDFAAREAGRPAPEEA